MFERFTQAAIQVILKSQEEARRLNHNFVGTAELLAGLIRVEEGYASQVLQAAGITLEQIQTAIEKRSGQGNAAPQLEMGFTPSAQRALQSALKFSNLQSNPQIDTEHLLLGVLAFDETSLARTILLDLGVDPGALQHKLMDELTTKALTTDASVGRLYVSLFNAIDFKRDQVLLGFESRFQLPTGLDILSVDVSLSAFDSGAYPIPGMIALACQQPDLYAAYEAKLQLFLQVGTQVGYLLLPQDRVVKVLRPYAWKTLRSGDTLSLPEILPHWQMTVGDLWVVLDS